MKNIDLYINAGVILVAITVWLILMINHYPKRKLPENIKENILQNGLIHFTLCENAEKIQREGLRPRQERAMSFLEKNMVWLYINNKNDFESKCNIVHKKGKRKEYDAVVFFTDICENELQKMRYRKSDMAIVYVGQFKPESIVIKKLDTVLSEASDTR